MEFWNIKDLIPPPVSSCKINAKGIDIRLLQITLKEGIEFFESQQQLSMEAALLSRSVYRFKMKFRSSKDFKTVEKLNHILHTYLQMHTSRMLKTLLQSVPHNYKANEMYMLTKNMMDFVLVRLQGLGQILNRVLELCKTVCSLMKQRIRLGHFWKIAALIFAIASRLFVIIKSILKFTCKLYEKLLPYSSKLGNSGVQWLPKNYCFPEHLDEWLNVDWLNLDNTVIEIVDDEPSCFLNLDDSEDDVEFCDEYIVINEEEEQLNKRCESTIWINDSVKCEDNVIEDETDIGDVVNISPTESDVGEDVNESATESTKKMKRKQKRNLHTLSRKSSKMFKSPKEKTSKKFKRKRDKNFNG